MSLKNTSGLSELLREYAPHSLIMDEFKRENFVFNQFDTDKGWKDGASYQIPWELSSGANDTQMGGLIDEADLDNGMGTYKKVVLNDQKVMSGAIKFLESDLNRYSDLKQSFLKIFPEKLTQLTDHMKANVATMVLRGGAICKVVGTGSVGGVVTLDKPQFLSIGQRVLLKDNDQSFIAYVRVINMNTKQVTFYDARVGGAVVDLSDFKASEGGKVMIPGQDTESLTSLQDYLLPASLGGLDTVHGVSKMASPLLQNSVVDGTGITASTVLDFLYDFYFTTKELGKVKNAELWVPYHIFKACVKLAQTSKRFIDGGKEAGFGFSKITLIGMEGNFTLMALNDMPNDQIMLLDKSAFKFVGDTFFERKKQLDGEEYFAYRKSTGMEYVADYIFRAEFVATKLSGSAIIHSVPLL